VSVGLEELAQDGDFAEQEHHAVAAVDAALAQAAEDEDIALLHGYKRAQAALADDGLRVAVDGHLANDVVHFLLNRHVHAAIGADARGDGEGDGDVRVGDRAGLRASGRVQVSRGTGDGGNRFTDRDRALLRMGDGDGRVRQHANVGVNAGDIKDGVQV